MTELSDKARELETWWANLAQEEVERVVPKAIEYGAHDLVEIGRTLGAISDRDDLTEAELAELGCYFYLVGKLARWTDAIRERRAVSDDTLHDIGVYVRMVQRIRAVGGWPFGGVHGPDEIAASVHHVRCFQARIRVSMPTVTVVAPDGSSRTFEGAGVCGDQHGAARCDRPAGHDLAHYNTDLRYGWTE